MRQAVLFGYSASNVAALWPPITDSLCSLVTGSILAQVDDDYLKSVKRNLLLPQQPFDASARLALFLLPQHSHLDLEAETMQATRWRGGSHRACAF